MKMNRKETKETINRVMKGAKKSTIDLYSAICIDPAGYISSRNATFSITEKCDIEATADEKPVYLSAVRIFKIMSHLKGDSVEIKEDGSKVVITSENAKFEEPIMAGAFEAQKFGEPLTTTKVNVSEFTDIINQVIHSVDHGDGSEIMGAINFKISETGLKATTLDGHRISIRDIGNTSEALEINLKAEDVKSWVNSLQGDTVDIMNFDSQVVLKTDATTIAMTKVNGDYYNVDQILSVTPESFITVDKSALYDATNLALLNRRSNRPLMAMEISSGALKITSNSDNGSGFNTELVCQTNLADGFKVGVNADFLVDALNTIDEDTIKLEVINAVSPLIMRTETYTEVVLPVKLD